MCLCTRVLCVAIDPELDFFSPQFSAERVLREPGLDVQKKRHLIGRKWRTLLSVNACAASVNV